jgi:hypothetical protein
MKINDNQRTQSGEKKWSMQLELKVCYGHNFTHHPMVYNEAIVIKEALCFFSTHTFTRTSDENEVRKK